MVCMTFADGLGSLYLHHLGFCVHSRLLGKYDGKQLAEDTLIGTDYQDFLSNLSGE